MREFTWSSATEAAWSTLDALKAFSDDVDFLSGDLATTSSLAIGQRWSYLLSHLDSIALPATRFMRSPLDGLEYELRRVDEANIDFDEEDRGHSIARLKFAVGEYAEVIVRALKDRMTPEEADEFEDIR